MNTLSARGARDAFLDCCASGRWADAMVAARPFADEGAVHAAADAQWRALGPADWHEAFAAHPRIGERHAAAGERTGAWSAREQAAASRASDEVRAELAQVNTEYESRFGHVYLVCANGRSAADLLADAHARMENDKETELRVAAEELRQITHLRLTRLLEGEG